ncbi:MAG: ribulose-phosphate 3-epimerase [Firmicutes bacterium]|nr:ribulose-phosphate 3-epimerase [Bacillota bacterium]
MQSRIAASMMCADAGNLSAGIRAAAAAGVDLLHFDVMDGRFVPNFGFSPWMIKALKGVADINILFEAHLMIEDPERHVKTFIDTGADIIVIHLEACRNIYPVLKGIRRAGARAGVALSPPTSPEPLRYILPYVDIVTVMTVSPGFAGGEFLPEMVSKVEDVSRMIAASGLDISIEVDGNINARTIPLLARAGANVFVGGSSGLYRKDVELSQAVREMRAAAERAGDER